LGDEELIKDVIPIFLSDNRERLEKLAEAVKAGDAENIRLYAHAIKGAGSNVGASRLRTSSTLQVNFYVAAIRMMIPL
jgi:HPt (histidine-containing phosphotransfer) domain-containing protein